MQNTQPQIIAFNAQGQPVTDIRNTMQYRSQQLQKQHNDKYSAYKATNGSNFQPCNQDQSNGYNDSYGDLNEVFLSNATTAVAGSTTAPQQSNFQSPANPSQNVHAAHTNLVQGFETASMNLEETGQMPAQINPLHHNFPVHMPRQQGTQQMNQVSQHKPKNYGQILDLPCRFCMVSASRHGNIPHKYAPIPTSSSLDQVR